MPPLITMYHCFVIWCLLSSLTSSLLLDATCGRLGSTHWPKKSICQSPFKKKNTPKRCKFILPDSQISSNIKMFQANSLPFAFGFSAFLSKTFDRRFPPNLSPSSSSFYLILWKVRPQCRAGKPWTDSATWEVKAYKISIYDNLMQGL